MKQLLYILFIAVLPIFLSGQEHKDILKDLQGEALLNGLRSDFTPVNIFDYGHARDTLFRKIYGVNDSLSGIYSGMRLYMDPSKDPTTTVYLSGIANGINTEHCYPKSKGAKSGNAKSDMHHLFPSRLAVNSDRGNLPFGEINDNITKKWYINASERSSIPTNNIDGYSEWNSDRFEPRESVKGNVARAIFYFFTIYHNKAMAADPFFFEDQKATLCEWHKLDPIDSTEWARSVLIGTYQEGKANPFILDCSLVMRAYCPDLDFDCRPNGVKNITEIAQDMLSQNQPNPFVESTSIHVDYDGYGMATIRLMDMMGDEVSTIYHGAVSPGISTYKVHSDLPSGVYYYQLIFEEKGDRAKRMEVKRMIKY